MRQRSGGVIKGCLSVLVLLFLGILLIGYFANSNPSVSPAPSAQSVPPPVTPPVASVPASPETPQPEAEPQAPPTEVQSAPVATPPAPTIEALQAKVDSDREAVRKSEALAKERLHSSAEYRSVKADSDAKLAVLQQARQTGAPQEKLDASRDYVATLQTLKKMEATAQGTDPGRISAIQQLAADEVALGQLQREQEAKQQATAEQAQRAIDSDPITIAISKHRLIEGMTGAQALEAMGCQPYSVTRAGSIETATWEISEGNFWSATFFGDSIVEVSHTRL
jgi:hypothetical protein